MFGTLVGGCLCEHCNGQAGYSKGMQGNRCVVEVAEDMNTEGVDYRMGDEDGGVDTNGSGCRGFVIIQYSRCGGYGSCESKAYSCCYSYLAEEVEPGSISSCPKQE